MGWLACLLTCEKKGGKATSTSEHYVEGVIMRTGRQAGTRVGRRRREKQPRRAQELEPQKPEKMEGRGKLNGGRREGSLTSHPSGERPLPCPPNSSHHRLAPTDPDCLSARPPAPAHQQPGRSPHASHHSSDSACHAALAVAASACPARPPQPAPLRPGNRRPAPSLALCPECAPASLSRRSVRLCLPSAA